MNQFSNQPHNRKAKLVILAIVIVMMLAALVVPFPLAAASQARRIQIDARQFAYAPEIFVVNRGDTITLRLESSDAAHGLFIDGYEVNISAEPGKSAEITFVADKEGTFKFRCSIPCGNLHPFMIGELNVEPNEPRARALVVTMIVAVGATLYFWKKA